MSCPICQKPTVAHYRPFCSSRCAHVDLGKWLSGSYAIPGEPVEESDLPTDPADEQTRH